jgi:GNAT superfamily N-acetyltransferase
MTSISTFELNKVKQQKDITFKWSQVYNSEDLSEILSLVEPNEIERKTIINCFDNSTIYRGYVAHNFQTKNIDAIVIATYLTKTETLHIEDFALHPRIRGQGYARSLWSSWLELIVEEKWIHSLDTAISIEVYKQNVEPWSKIMGVKTIETALLPLTGVEIVWMAKNLKRLFKEVFDEWTDIQANYQLTKDDEDNSVKKFKACESRILDRISQEIENLKKIDNIDHIVKCECEENDSMLFMTLYFESGNNVEIWYNGGEDDIQIEGSFDNPFKGLPVDASFIKHQAYAHLLKLIYNLESLYGTKQDRCVFKEYTCSSPNIPNVLKSS